MTRIAIAHDYLTQRGGAERVVLALARAFPGAPIYTTFYDADNTFPEFKDLDVRPSPANHWRWLRRNHRVALPLLPFISAAIKIRADLVIVSSTGWAHGFRKTGESIVYCHSPARWIYQGDTYLGEDANRLVRIALAGLKPFLRWWDKRSAARSGDYIANSTIVQTRIKHAYGKDALVVHAPQTVNARGESEPIEELDRWIGDDDYYLCVSRLLPYKNVQAIIGAVDDSPGRKLVVIGAGPDESRLRALASENVLFLKELSDGQMRTAYSRCRALIAASYEDFGLTPLEAASYGRPSIVLRWGGFLDTMVEGVTAAFFDEPDSTEILQLIKHFEASTWDAVQIEIHADKFRESAFADTIVRLVEAKQQIIIR